MSSWDVAVVGGGIVGLSTAYRLMLRSPRRLRVVVLEKEPEVARHQSGRNSGVVHSAIYYPPGTQKAQFCRRGRQMLIDLCRQRGIPLVERGKVIVALDEGEASRVRALLQNAQGNGVPAEWLTREGLVRREPHCGGVGALWVPEAACVDFAEVTRALRASVEDAGGTVLTGNTLTAVRPRSGGVELHTQELQGEARLLIGCAGLYADRVAALAGYPPSVRIVPFRGEFMRLRGDAANLCRGLIYPAPDATLPFLGVHVTRAVDDVVECGPNAVFALGRQAYRGEDSDLIEAMSSLLMARTWRLFAAHWRTGLGELLRAYSHRRFTHSVQRLLPEVRPEDLVRSRAGIRAQAVAPDGSLVNDFEILRGLHQLHVLNAPSPAATAALAIGDHLVALAAEDLGLTLHPPD